MSLANKQIAQNMLTLAALLETVPNELYAHHEYTSWAAPYGTAHCALGWANANRRLFNGGEYNPMGLRTWSDVVFGPGTYALVFDLFAYDVGVRSVTKEMPIKRLRKMARKLGYESA